MTSPRGPVANQPNNDQLLNPTPVVIEGELSPDSPGTDLPAAEQASAGPTETVQGSAGGGLVTATVDATGELVDLVIAPAVLAGDDEDLPQVVADLVIAAVRDAQTQRQELVEELAMEGFAQLGPLGALAEQMAGMLPPGFLSQLSGASPLAPGEPGGQPQIPSVPAGMPDLSGLLAGLPGLMQGLQPGASDPASPPAKPDDESDRD